MKCASRCIKQFSAVFCVKQGDDLGAVSSGDLWRRVLYGKSVLQIIRWLVVILWCRLHCKWWWQSASAVGSLPSCPACDTDVADDTPSINRLFHCPSRFAVTALRFTTSSRNYILLDALARKCLLEERPPSEHAAALKASTNYQQPS